MTNYCYTPMDSPAFFYGEGDCDIVSHDLMVKSGDLSPDENQIISAILIQLNSDLVKDGERGFWGDEFIGFPLGTHLWTLNGQANTTGITVKADQMIRQALEPLISQGLIDSIQVKATRIVGGVEAQVDVIKDGKSLFTMVV